MFTLASLTKGPRANNERASRSTRVCPLSPQLLLITHWSTIYSCWLALTSQRFMGRECEWTWLIEYYTYYVTNIFQYGSSKQKKWLWVCLFIQRCASALGEEAILCMNDNVILIGQHGVRVGHTATPNRRTGVRFSLFTIFTLSTAPTFSFKSRSFYLVKQIFILEKMFEPVQQQTAYRLLFKLKWKECKVEQLLSYKTKPCKFKNAL